MARLRLKLPSPGIGFAIAAPLLYSTNIPLSKILLNHVEPWMLAGLLDLGAAVGIGLVLACRWLINPQSLQNRLKGRDWRWLIGSILAGGLIAPVLQTYGIANSTASVASLLFNLEGVFTALIAWFVFKEVFEARVAWGLTAITVGSIALVWTGDSMLSFSWGAMAIAAAALAWATSSNFTQKISLRDPLQVTFLRTCTSGSLNVGFALLAGNALPNAGMIGVIAIAGFLCIGLTFICFILALRHIGASRTGTFFSLFPFSGAVLAIVILGEPVTAKLAIAALLMAVGLGFCLSQRQRREGVLPLK